MRYFSGESKKLPSAVHGTTEMSGFATEWD